MEWKQHSAVLGIFVVLTLVMTWPVVPQLATHVAGSGGDPWQTLWRFGDKQHAAQQALSEGRFFSFIEEEFLGLSGPHLVNISVWPWMPLHALFGEPVGYNLVWLLSFILAGYSMYLLVYYISHQTLPRGSIDMPALLAGVVYMFLPFHVAQSLGHFGAMQIMWLPFILLTGMLWLRKPTFWKSVLLAALIIIQAWTEHHYILWLGIFVVVALILRWSQFMEDVRAQKTQYTRNGAVVAILLFVGVVMAMLPTARFAIGDSSALNLGDDQLVRFSADLFSFVTPAQFQPIWGNAFYKIFSSDFTGNVSESTQYVSIIVLLLVLFFHHPVPKSQKIFWSTIAIVFFLVSLGPVLHIFGHITGIPLPYALIKNLPIITSVRAVARAGVFVGLALSVLFGLTLSKQLHRKGIVVALLALMLLDFAFFPVPMESAKLSPVYDAVKNVSGSAVIEIPAATNYTIASRALYASLLHHKEVVGNIALERAADPKKLELTKRVPGLKQLLFLRTTELREGRKEFFNQDISETLLDAMSWLDADSIIVHNDSLSVLQNEAIQKVLNNERFFSHTSYGDATLYIRKPDAYGDGVLLVRDDSWENIGFDENRGAVFAEVPGSAAVDIINTSGVNQTIHLQYDVAPESPDSIYMSDDSGTIEAGQAIVLPPGIHAITFNTRNGGRGILMNPKLAVDPL